MEKANIVKRISCAVVILGCLAAICWMLISEHGKVLWVPILIGIMSTIGIID